MKKYILFIVSVFACISVQGHTIDFTLDKLNPEQISWTYFKLGFTHILPFGLDHILFIMCIFLLNTKIKSIIIQASMFTLAHTITLGLAMYGILNISGGIVEPIIALSIVFLAVENIFAGQIKPWRILMVFLFGLVHGLGFAGVLSELGMPSYAFANALISFNIGVEIGQLSIILLMYVLISRPYAQKIWYRKRIVIPASIIIAMVAGFWTFERIL